MTYWKEVEVLPGQRYELVLMQTVEEGTVGGKIFAAVLDWVRAYGFAYRLELVGEVRTMDNSPGWDVALDARRRLSRI